MIVAVFSDVHGNLPALESFLKAAQPVAEAYVCLGDVVNYGPWNDECLEMVCSLPGIVLLEGNHERLFLGTDLIEHEIPLVQEFFKFSRQCFSRRDLIGQLPESYQLGRFECRHTIDGQRIYADTAITPMRDYFIGHTHHQFSINGDGSVIVNCGSIGQNRADLDIASYVLFNTQTGTYQLCGQAYNSEHFIAELARRRYPQQCIDYYGKKRKRTK